MDTITRNIPDDLPEADFVDVNTETLVNRLVTGYEEIMGRTLYPADPVRAFILWLASIIVQERILINESAKQNLPRYAEGENLDSLNEIFHNAHRLQPQAATTKLRFHLTVVPQEDYIIADELEVTVDGEINFVTVGDIIFKAGEIQAEVQAVCTSPGEIGNGFMPGQINQLVSEEFLYFKEVENITETGGGSETESDEAFYNRMRESEGTYTTAGPAESYIYHAKSVSSRISDVSAESPEPGVADIRIMLYDGEMPEEELLEKVRKHLSQDGIRPMTDKVIVAAPDRVDFDIRIRYYIPKPKAESTNEIQEKVKKAVEEYISWQTSKMGRDINPSYFSAVLMKTGIKRVEIMSPTFTLVEKGSIAVAGEQDVIYGGLEDE